MSFLEQLKAVNNISPAIANDFIVVSFIIVMF
jgi:hypothetical protein